MKNLFSLILALSASFLLNPLAFASGEKIRHSGGDIVRVFDDKSSSVRQIPGLRGRVVGHLDHGREYLVLGEEYHQQAPIWRVACFLCKAPMKVWNLVIELDRAREILEENEIYLKNVEHLGHLVSIGLIDFSAFEDDVMWAYAGLEYLEGEEPSGYDGLNFKVIQKAVN